MNFESQQERIILGILSLLQLPRRRGKKLFLYVAMLRHTRQHPIHLPGSLYVKRV